MKRILILSISLCMASAMIVFGAGDTEAAEGASAAEMAALIELPIEGQAEYNLSDYERLTGNSISSFSESPLLAEMVASGELPPVSERLPDDILVRVPLQEIGKYGGTINLQVINLMNPYPGNQMMTEMLFVVDIRNFGIIAPGLAKGYDVSEDGRITTLRLREGMKWSDGEPFTADDFLFWWEDVTLNEEITPGIPSIWLPDGERIDVEKVDDYTVQFIFPAPAYNAPVYFAQNTHMAAIQGRSFLPKHALTRYHIDYNDDAGTLAKEAGFDEWWQLLREKALVSQGVVVVPEVPTVGQYALESEFDNGRTFVRNPYYHAIDPAGNQLPYIDRTRTISTQDNNQTLKLRTIAGDYDYVPFGFATTDLPLLVANQDKGGYEAFLTNGAYPNDQPLLINQNNSEPVLGDLLRNKNFRQALSVALDRQEIIDVLALSMATPRQSTVNPTHSLFKESYATSYTEFDPDKANMWLDELGLTNRDGEGFQVMSNGKTLSLLIEPTTTFAGSVETAELVKEYWEDVGIKIAIKTGTYSTVFSGSVAAGTFHVTIVLSDMGAESMWRVPGYWNGPRDVMRINWAAPLWDSWWQSGGEQGVEPTEEAKRIFYIAENLFRFPPDEYQAAGEELLDWWAENFYTIGTFGFQQAPMTAKNNLGNIDKDTFHTSPSDYGKGYIYRLWQLYWRD